MSSNVAPREASEAAAPVPQEIESSYEFASEMLLKLGGANFHCGWWDSPEDPRTLAEAQDHLTDQVVAQLDAVPGAAVLDLGCGTGAPAMRIARATGAQVLGVSVIGRHVDEANEQAAREGLGEQVRFETADAHHLDCAESSFDAIVAIESLGHMERAVVLPRLRSFLKPGGRLVVHDYFLHESVNAAQRAVAEAFRGIALLGEYPGPAEIARLVGDAGLDLLEFRDVTEQTSTPTYVRFGKHFREEVAPALGEAYSEEFLQRFLDFFESSEACGGPHHYTQWIARRPLDAPGGAAPCLS